MSTHITGYEAPSTKQGEPSGRRAGAQGWRATGAAASPPTVPRGRQRPASRSRASRAASQRWTASSSARSLARAARRLTPPAPRTSSRATRPARPAARAAAPRTRSAAPRLGGAVAARRPSRPHGRGAGEGVVVWWPFGPSAQASPSSRRARAPRARRRRAGARPGGCARAASAYARVHSPDTASAVRLPRGVRRTSVCRPSSVPRLRTM